MFLQIAFSGIKIVNIKTSLSAEVPEVIQLDTLTVDICSSPDCFFRHQNCEHQNISFC